MKEKNRWGWAIVLSYFVMGFLCDGFRNSYGLLYLEFLREFGETKSMTSLIGSIMSGLMNFLGPVTSILIKKFGCRVVAVSGGAICAFGLIASVLSKTLYHLYISIGIIGGIGFAMLMMPAHIMVIRYFKNRRAFAMGIATSGSGVGSIAFSPLLKLLIDKFGWKGALLIEGALILHCVPCGLAMRPILSENKEDELPAIANADIQRARTANCTSKTPYKNKHGFLTECKKLFNIHLLRNSMFKLVLISFLLEGLAFSIPATFLPDLTIYLGYSRSNATWLLSAIAVANTACRIPVGMIADNGRVNRLYMDVGLLVLVGACIVLMAFSTSFVALMFVCICYGTFLGCYVVLQSLVLADLFGDDLIADAKGFAAFTYGIAGFSGLPIAGALFDLSRHYTLTFLVAGVEYILCSGFLATVACVKKKQGTYTIEQ